MGWYSNDKIYLIFDVLAYDYLLQKTYFSHILLDKNAIYNIMIARNMHKDNSIPV